MKSIRALFSILKIYLSFYIFTLGFALVCYIIYFFMISIFTRPIAAEFFNLDILIYSMKMAAVVSLVGFIFIFIRMATNKMFKLGGKVKKELLTNGTTERFFEMIDQGIELYKKYPRKVFEFHEFTIYGSEGYMINGDLDKALHYIGLMDEKKIREKSLNASVHWLCLVQYLLVKMELIEEQLEAAEAVSAAETISGGAGNQMYAGSEYIPSPLIEQADAIYTEASFYREKEYGKNDEVSMLLDELSTLYSFIHKDYTSAIDYSQKVIDNKLHRQNKLISGHLNLAYAYYKLGDNAKVDELVTEMNQIMETSKNALSRENYKFMMKKMGRDEGSADNVTNNSGDKVG